MVTSATPYISISRDELRYVGLTAAATHLICYRGHAS